MELAHDRMRKRTDNDLRILRSKQAIWDLHRNQLEQQIERLKQEATTRHALHQGGSDNEVLQYMRTLVYCSTCKDKLRNVVITKCMHSAYCVSSYLRARTQYSLHNMVTIGFCKDCIDARIATRQRKCPACQVPFGQGDVQTYYMQ